ncbi:hypothetical protein HF313_11865 [Massilia atriviolacea]|uniref:Uncharacterized protein n=1 Tax=Massilia atriviolacea TaxID=2495579 RepID=A0A430HIU1_9BURK|nr:hypothetical protein [Massilia atriviolacea]RSZ57425.1 hypothetical protein EJB06_19990 [Massilia atriviolacea]
MYSTAIWLRPPHAPAGHVLIDNTSARSPGEQPVARLLTYEQVRITAQLAVRLESELATQGEESFLGRCLEAELPG